MSRLRLSSIVAIGVVAVSFAAIFVRLADAPSIIIASYRMLLASLVLLPWTIRGLKASHLKRRNLVYTLLAGCLLAIHFASYIAAIKLTSITASTTLVTTNPLWIMLFSWIFLRYSPSLSVLMGVLIAILGVALIAFNDVNSGATASLGNALALLGAISFAGYFLLGRSAQVHGLSLQTYAGLAYSVAALVLLPLPWLFGTPYTGYSWSALLWILLLALVPQIIGHTSFNFAIRFLDPTVVATATLMEPVGATLLGIFIFSEIPGYSVGIGALIVLTGISIVAFNSRAYSSS